jgi:hypothetical protein
MDANGVDRLAPSRSIPASRRLLLRTALAGLLAFAGRDIAGAEKSSRNKKKSRKKKDNSSSDCNSECDDDLSCARCGPQAARQG